MVTGPTVQADLVSDASSFAVKFATYYASTENITTRWEQDIQRALD